MIDANQPASPCIRVCRIDRMTGYCLGCWRTGEEIGAWPGLNAEARHALLRQLAQRAKAGAKNGTGPA
ncbi:MAG TPA: DUF1289 domain-containing protein [Ferrovibrio sp.]|jgi:predicted Fe-S protein YdhL (DUF1289 family)|uniref:DUF1289 domain-containing protein n=1 Tax=Ferrovibrio sp. TaxID=1917215 RepID=UPI002ED6303A